MKFFTCIVLRVFFFNQKIILNKYARTGEPLNAPNHSFNRLGKRVDWFLPWVASIDFSDELVVFHSRYFVIYCAVASSLVQQLTYLLER